MFNIISISLGAILGALLRWQLGESLNYLFPKVPLGTLITNLFGCFMMGMMIFFIRDHAFFSNEIRLGIVTGFLGSLTTFSTFSAEAFALLARDEFTWFIHIILFHVIGSLIMVIAGYFLTKSIYYLGQS